MKDRDCGGPRNLLPDQTDLELAVDADLNRVWESECDKPTPAQTVTIEQAQFVGEKIRNGDDTPPSSRS